MPADKDGKHIDPAGWNRNDGFSPGQTILTHVRGLDNEQAFGRTEPGPALRHQPLHRPEGADRRDQREDGERHPIWAELDPHPARRGDVNLQIRPRSTGTRVRVTSSPCAGCSNAKGDVLPRAPPSGSTGTVRRRTTSSIESRRAHMNSIFRKLRKAGIGRKSLYLAWDFTVASERNLSGARPGHARRRVLAARRHRPRGRDRAGECPGVHGDQHQAVNGEPGVEHADRGDVPGAVLPRQRRAASRAAASATRASARTSR